MHLAVAGTRVRQQAHTVEHYMHIIDVIIDQLDLKVCGGWFGVTALGRSERREAGGARRWIISYPTSVTL